MGVSEATKHTTGGLAAHTAALSLFPVEILLPPVNDSLDDPEEPP